MITTAETDGVTVSWRTSITHRKYPCGHHSKRLGDDFLASSQRPLQLSLRHRRARFVPFFVPRGGITSSPFLADGRFLPGTRHLANPCQRRFLAMRDGEPCGWQRSKGDLVYIGGGALALIIIILLLIWIF